MLFHFLIIWVLVVLQNVIHCQESRLVKKLLANYSMSARPLRNSLKSLDVWLDSVRLIGIDNFDEMTATLSLRGWIKIVSFIFVSYMELQKKLLQFRIGTTNFFVGTMTKTFQISSKSVYWKRQCGHLRSPSSPTHPICTCIPYLTE